MQAEIRKQTETFLDQILGKLQVHPELIKRVQNDLKPTHVYTNKIELQAAIKNALLPNEIGYMNSILFHIQPSYLPTVNFTQRQQILDAFYEFEEAYKNKFPTKPLKEIHTILFLIAEELKIPVDSFYSVKTHSKAKGIQDLFLSTKIFSKL
jgi:hypothetical protein